MQLCVTRFQFFLLSFIAKGQWLHCSATKPKIWYQKPEVSQHEQVKLFLTYRFVLNYHIIFDMGVTSQKKKEKE